VTMIDGVLRIIWCKYSAHNVDLSTVHKCDRQWVHYKGSMYHYSVHTIESICNRKSLPRCTNMYFPNPRYRLRLKSINQTIN